MGCLPNELWVESHTPIALSLNSKDPEARTVLVSAARQHLPSASVVSQRKEMD